MRRRGGQADERDRLLIMPLVLVLVGLVLVVLLRALVAPVLLVITVVASFFASLVTGSPATLGTRGGYRGFARLPGCGGATAGLLHHYPVATRYPR
ncbi:MMPL family transporter [Kribbella deserti]|uniref:MMPL family transporter n=1 Tax=Kribbella deserti TaxID=1926257 RepID=A0ABV6QP84_9ACTN